MSGIDFLFNGTPPPSTTTYGSTVSNVPTWLSDYTQGLIAKANAVGGEGYVPYTGPRVAGMTTPQQQAADTVEKNAGAFQPWNTQAAQQAGGALGTTAPWVSQANQNLGAATGVTGAAISPGMGGLSTAAPWLGAASGTFTGSTVGNYMNPYVDAVTNRAATLANRNFTEQIMPQLNDQFVGAGQFGSTRHQELANRGARDVSENLQQQQQADLAQAYQAGQGAFQSDASRMAGLAGTAGQLGTQGQTAMLNAGQQLGSIGAQYGTIGNQQGSLATSSAGALSNIAQQGQQMGVTDAAQLGAIGDQQQQLNQRNLDTAYGDFQNQVNYPRNTIDWMNNLVHGLPTTTNVTQAMPQAANGPSPLAQLTSLATGLTGLQKLNSATGTTLARGGMVSAPRIPAMRQPYVRPIKVNWNRTVSTPVPRSGLSQLIDSKNTRRDLREV